MITYPVVDFRVSKHPPKSACEQNYVRAAEWFEKAALQGDADAQCSLGTAYELGRGVPQSDDKAFEFYAQSAAQGISQAQCNLAVS